MSDISNFRVGEKVVATVEESLAGYQIVDCAITSFGDSVRVILVAEEKHPELEAGDTYADLGIEHHTTVVIYKPEKNPEQAWGWQRFTGLRSLKAGSCSLPEPGAICVDMSGNVAVMRAGFNGLDPKVSSANGSVGVVMDAQEIDQHTYIVSSGRRVFRREAADKWRCLSADIFPEEAEKANDLTFEGIDGFSADDLYAVGGKGDVWHFDGTAWRAINLPVLPKTYRVCCADDGIVYITGSGGYLIKGRYDEWELIRDDAAKHPRFTDVVWFKDRVYLSSDFGLYQYVPGDSGISPVNYEAPSEAPPSTGFLAANKKILVAAGSSSISVFDGKQWTLVWDAYAGMQRTEKLPAELIDLLLGS